jgi:hypothetical protein
VDRQASLVLSDFADEYVWRENTISMKPCELLWQSELDIRATREKHLKSSGD